MSHYSTDDLYDPPYRSRAEKEKDRDDALKAAVEIIEEHGGFVQRKKLIRLMARRSKQSSSSMQEVLTFGQFKRDPAITMDYRTDNVHLHGTDLPAMMEAVKNDPWLGHPNHEWSLDGYRVDDEICDILSRLSKGEHVAVDLGNFLERLRARKFDVSAKEE